MRLTERISRASRQAPVEEPVAFLGSSPVTRRKEGSTDALRELKVKVHNRLFEQLDVSRLEALDPALISAKVTSTIGETLDEDGRLLTEVDRARLVDEVKNELLGLGPLEPLLHDDEVTDILVNGRDQVYVEKRGKLHETGIKFHDDRHLLLIIDRIVSQVGRRVDESSPMVDARLRDGSRVNAIIPPLAIDGPSLSIRRFGKKRYSIDDLVAKGSISPDMVALLHAVVTARLNMLVCGGTGSGKTTMLNCLSSFVPSDERIVTIEDSAELSLQQTHVVRLETRPPNLEGRGEVTARDLVRNTLRMRPDRIIVGEVRGAEIFDMLQAMSTGHDGSIATIHANSTRECLGRLEMMMLLSGYTIPQRAMRQQIASAIHMIAHVARLSDGSRRMMKISEITGMEGDAIMMQDLYEFVHTATDADGKVQGHYRPTGIRSAYAQRIERAGYRLQNLQRTGTD